MVPAFAGGISRPGRKVFGLLLAGSLALAGSIWADNIAGLGTGMLGVNDAVDSDAGLPHYNGGVAASINDGDTTTHVDDWFSNLQPGQPVSFVGIVWPFTRYEHVTTLTLTLATFGDGGWFGVPGALPPAGGALAATNLIEPTVQVTTDGGVTWTTVSDTSDYQTVMNGHQIGGTGGQPNPSSQAAVFTLDTAATAINGIRIIGPNGGLAGPDTNGFLGVFELAVEATPFDDTDGDGMADDWETTYGLTVGIDDSGDDTDLDGLSNLDEFAIGTHPNEFDTDGDGLADGDEVSFYGTNPLIADTDGDGLSDGDEANIYFTNPLVADSDGDGLNDGIEVNTYHSNPRVVDTDGDGFSDLQEVTHGTNPNNALNFPENFALIGTGIIGVKDTLTTGADVPYSQQGITALTNINDDNLSTRIDTYNGGTPTHVSYVGIVWPTLLTNSIVTLDLTMATFGDGGWFGVNNLAPLPGSALTEAHLMEPIVQVSADGGTTWEEVPFTSDYTNQMLGHLIGGGDQPNPSSVKVTFTLTAPAIDINGIRIIGTEGGTASGGFLGVFELATKTEVSDSDNDGMPDSWETLHGLTVGVDDSADDADSDGLSNVDEFLAGTDPQVADSDSDGLSDGDEVHTYATDPTVADTDGDGLSDGDEVNTYLTDPTLVDTDGDQFRDGAEVGQGTDPNDPNSYPSNMALAGSAIMGNKFFVDEKPGALYFQAGGLGNINDANLATHVDDWNNISGGPVSFVGIVWTNGMTNPIARLELTLATFGDGGWFGVNNAAPGAGTALTPAYLVEPEVQVTSNGTTWVTVPHASDYLTVANGHLIGGNGQPNPSSFTAHFILMNPVADIMGLRIIGSEGGTSSRGFLGVFELTAQSVNPDTDNDGMDDQWETLHGLTVGTDDSVDDPDGDGLLNVLEFRNGGDPQVADTDGDSLSDADEVNLYQTNPAKSDTDGDGLADNEEILTYRDRSDSCRHRRRWIPGWTGGGQEHRSVRCRQSSRQSRGDGYRHFGNSERSRWELRHARVHRRLARQYQ